jgi:agmatine deiminase
MVRDKSHPDFDNLLENRRRLDTTDARGRPIEVIESDLRGRPSVVGGRTIGTDYVNLYQANGALIVPTGGSAEDQGALEALGEIARGREIVGVPTPVLGYGGGGIHCITQQVPRSSAVSVAP